MSQSSRKSVFADPTLLGQFYQNQTENKARVFRPIELYLETEGEKKGLKVCKRAEEKDFQGNKILGKPQPREVRPLQAVGEKGIIRDQKDGLMSLFRKPPASEEAEGKSFYVTPRMLVCITCYNETKSQMEDSLDGLLQNLDHFEAKSGIGNHEIVVVVLFDGVDKINDCQNNDKSMMTLFQHEDRIYNIPNKMSMRHQKDEYQLMQKYAGLKVEELRKKGDLSIFKSDVDLNSQMEVYLTQQLRLDRERLEQNPQERRIRERESELEAEKRRESIKFDFLDLVKKRAQKYIEDRKQTGWVYMSRRELDTVASDDLAYLKKIERRSDYIPPDDRKGGGDRDTISGTHNDLENGEEDNTLLEHKKRQKEERQNYLYIFYCAKHRNGGKLSSHLWFFTGFCELFQPQYTVLVDCGLRPGPTSIYNFFLSMETDENIGGVCGFMGLKPENVYTDSGEREDGYDKRYVDSLTHCMNHIFDIQNAQVFEYDFAHIVDKPFESLFGFIHVLPGAFSGYRWDALKRKEDGDNILMSYLKTVITKDFSYSSLEEANMYLAEDRILCLKIYTRPGHRYKLRYIPTAKAVVDPVTTIPNLMGQRRRWINGTWYALDHVLEKQDIVYQSSHSAWEIFWYRVSMYYANMMRGVTYMTIGLTMATSLIVFQEFFIMMNQGFGFNSTVFVQIFMSLYTYLYITLVLVMIFYALNFNNRDKNANKKFYFVCTYLGLLTLASFAILFTMAIITVVKGYGKSDSGDRKEPEDVVQDDSSGSSETTILSPAVVWWSAAFTLAFNGIPVLFNLDKSLELLLVLFDYIYYSPTYIHALLIFAFCRIDDLSWGTKGLEAESGKDNLQQEFKWAKFKFVSKWIFSNTLFVTVVQMFMNEFMFKKVLLYALGGFGIFILFVRCLGALLYYLYFYLYFNIKMKLMQKQSLRENEEASRRSRIKLQNFFEAQFVMRDSVAYMGARPQSQLLPFDVVGTQRNGW